MNTITRLVVYGIIAMSLTTLQAQVNQDSTKVENSINEVRQDHINEQIQKLIELKAKVEEQEKQYLKQDIEVINNRLDKKEISAEEAENFKKEAAKKRAANIENRLTIIDNKIALLNRNGDYYDMDNDTYKLGLNLGKFTGIEFKTEDRSIKPRKYDRRTTDNIVIAFGLNNTIIDGVSLDDSPYKIGGSGFMELGYAWKTRLFKNSNFWRLKYGFSFQWNKLDIKNDLFFVNNDGAITLQEFPSNLNKAKFRTTNLVFPVHIEFGPSKKIESKNYFRYSTHHKLKIGIGGYAGLNIGSMQKLKYKEDGNRIKNKQRGGFEVNEFVYGLSSYIAWGDVALYLKYDLNPLFKNQTVDQNNISVGLRFDMD